MRVLFFHRLDLTHLYAPLAALLSKDHEVIHVAYSSKEEAILRNQYGLTDVIYNVSEAREKLLSKTVVNQKRLDLLDNFIIKFTNNRFNFNASLQFDRTYLHQTYDEACQLSLFYFDYWSRILKDKNPDFVFHEPPALFMTHILAITCKSLFIKYLTQIHIVGKDRFQWIFLEGDNAFPLEIQNVIRTKNFKFSEREVDEFIQVFREDFSVLLGNEMSSESSDKNFRIYRFAKGVLSAFFNEMSNWFRKENRNNPLNHIDHFLMRNRTDIFVRLENLYCRLFRDYYEEPKKNDKYFFYPFHLEPEAVVLYYGDGIYSGQIKLIENIAAQIPAGYFLYVKDHPHGGNYRNSRDFEFLIRIPNVKIIDPSISGKSLIAHSVGVITINGTVGFEALLMNKLVFCFGNSFYSSFKGVNMIQHVKDLKQIILHVLEEPIAFDRKDINAFLSASHPGFVGFFGGRQNMVGIDLDYNAKVIATCLETLMNLLKNDN